MRLPPLRKVLAHTRPVEVDAARSGRHLVEDGVARQLALDPEASLVGLELGGDERPRALPWPP